MSTIGDWLGQQPILLAVIAGGTAVIGALVALRGTYRTAQSTDRATEQDRQEAYWSGVQADVLSLRTQHSSNEARLDEMSGRMASMQSQLNECLQERNELRARVAGCNQRIKDIEAQIARLQGGRRGNGAESSTEVI